jgi:hypothetical protein
MITRSHMSDHVVAIGEEMMQEQERKKKLFEEHLAYELNMFDEAAKFLMSEEFSKLDRQNNKDDWFRANAAIEAFWTHARTLQEFFRKAQEPRAFARRASRLRTRLCS